MISKWGHLFSVDAAKLAYSYKSGGPIKCLAAQFTSLSPTFLSNIILVKVE